MGDAILPWCPPEMDTRQRLWLGILGKGGNDRVVRKSHLVCNTQITYKCSFPAAPLSPAYQLEQIGPKSKINEKNHLYIRNSKKGRFIWVPVSEMAVYLLEDNGETTKYTFKIYAGTLRSCDTRHLEFCGQCERELMDGYPKRHSLFDINIRKTSFEAANEGGVGLLVPNSIKDSGC